MLSTGVILVEVPVISGASMVIVITPGLVLVADGMNPTSGTVVVGEEVIPASSSWRNDTSRKTTSASDDKPANIWNKREWVILVHMDDFSVSARTNDV
jgi:hypothetical protein